jgi:hypothetical protein
MREQVTRIGTVTADWMKRWGLHEQTKNLLDAQRTPSALEYLHRYDMESAYLVRREQDETAQAYKRRLYATVFTILGAAAGENEMRVNKEWPQIKWAQVRKNLSDAPVTEATRMA